MLNSDLCSWPGTKSSALHHPLTLEGQGKWLKAGTLALWEQSDSVTSIFPPPCCQSIQTHSCPTLSKGEGKWDFQSGRQRQRRAGEDTADMAEGHVFHFYCTLGTSKKCFWNSHKEPAVVWPGLRRGGVLL